MNPARWGWASERGSAKARWGRAPERGSVRILRRLILPGCLVVIGVLAYLLLPGGLPRAVLTVPTLLWVPGRSVLAALRIVGSARKWSFPLSVLLSIPLIILAALATNLITGSVPLAVLPLIVSAVALPLNLMDGGWGGPTGPALRFGAFGLVALLAGAAIVLAVTASLPGEPRSPYLEFSLGGQYAKVAGTVAVTSGEVLDLPLQVTVSGRGLTGLTVTANLNGQPVPNLAPVPVLATDATDGHAEIKLTVPAACLTKATFVLMDGSTQLRSVNLYLKGSGGKSCASS